LAEKEALWSKKLQNKKAAVQLGLSIIIIHVEGRDFLLSLTNEHTLAGTFSFHNIQ
jgi:hypothetical protein